MDLRLDQLAVLLDVAEDSIRQWVSCGGIPSYTINDELRFNREEVEDWLIHNHGVIPDEKREEKGSPRICHLDIAYIELFIGEGF